MKYTVVGLYLDGEGAQRFAECVEANDPTEAEGIILDQATESLYIAGVFEGDHQAVDVR